jgi:5-formyltetrahydrofolate cyclo-ligase
MDIKFLRQEMRRRRQALSAAMQNHFSVTICQNLITTPVFQRSQKIACYYPQNGEVDILQLKKLYPQKKYYLPILNPDGTNSLVFGLYSDNSVLIKNKYDIPEPDASAVPLISPEDLDLVIVPLVLFDTHCNRVGMGAGFYDRTFAFKTAAPESKPYLLGVAYELQKIDSLPANPWDVQMNAIITEERAYPK